MAENMLTEARRLLSHQFSVLPIRPDGSKAPALSSWKEFESRRPTPEELWEWFSWDSGAPGAGIAIIAGKVSGNAECLDFDDRAAWKAWVALVREQDPALLDRLTVVGTPRPGYAAWYRSVEAVPGNTKLARGLRPDEAGTMRVRTLIETRGEGGYQIAPPSPGTCHPSGQPYRLLHGDFAALPVLTKEQRALLIESAQALTEYVEPARSPAPLLPESVPGDRPGDRYNGEGDWEGLLTRYGWTHVRDQGVVQYWRRPGKTHGISASLGYVAASTLYVFSANAFPLTADRAFDLFGALTRLEYGGDFRAAGEALYAQGYGRPLAAVQRHLDEVAAPQPPTAVTVEPGEGEEEEGEGTDLNCTDLGNSRRLARAYESRLRYSASHGWMVYDGKRWKRDDLQQAVGYAKRTIQGLYKEAAGQEEKGDRKRLADWGIRSEGVARIMAMLKLAESAPEIALNPKILDVDPWVLNLTNGTLCLKNGTLHPHNNADLLTRLAPVTFDPAASCPTWLSFLGQIMGGRQDLVDYLQLWSGYCLTGDVSEQKLLFLYGTGSNGKTSFFHILMQLLGDYASASTPGLLLEHHNEQHPTAVAELAGQRLVVNSEAGQGKRLAEELLKRLTGSEPIKARFMNKDFFQFEPQYKLILSANHRPTIHGTDEAIWRRIPVVPFVVTFYEPGEGEPVKDMRIYEKLMGELPGILNWCLAGCLTWQKSGMFAPDPVKEAAASYRADMDILGTFLLESCRRVDASLSIRSGTLYERYKEWCSTSGETAVSQVIFSRALVERGFSKERRNTGVIWLGLQLSDEAGE